MTDTLQPTAFEVRFDALVSRLQRLAKVAGGGTVGNELRDVADEMARIRRDMAYALTGVEIHEPPPSVVESPGTVSSYLGAKPPRGGTGGGSTKGIQRIKGRSFTPPKGKRWCAGHNDGEGAMLSVKDFKVKNPRTGQLTSWCTACTRKYQQDRYVRVGFKRVTVEVKEGDACVGHDCPVCGMPFEIGERVQGENVKHEGCASD
jgi:hypothetical protein